MSRYHIHVRIEMTRRNYSEVLRAAAQLTLARQDADPTDVTVVLTDSERIRALNRQFLGMDRDTDVLAFPHGEVDPDHGRTYLGDIVISLPQAQKQAKQLGHSLGRELALLSIHGTLHLLGYDDTEPREKQEMETLQREIIAGLDEVLDALREK